MAHPPGGAIGLVDNRRARFRGPFGHGDILSLTTAAAAQRVIRAAPRYLPTPLRSLSSIAAGCGVATVWYKDEAQRGDLGSFKILGAGYALQRMMVRLLGDATGSPVALSQLAEPRHRTLMQGMTVTCASDGNHGRALAAAARDLGCRCVIFLHTGVSVGRQAAIESLGAGIVRVAGSYDESVRAAAAAAAERGWHVVSDTAWAGYERIPAEIMQGYTMMAAEVLDQLASEGAAWPSHIFVQAGVGGLAAALCAYFWAAGGADGPRFIVVEPARADCLFQSAMAGRPVPAAGDLQTVMAGLSCGEVSPLAWRILHDGAHAFMTIRDAAAIDAMRRLAGLPEGPLTAGESGAAGLAALCAATADRRVAAALGLDSGSRVLLFGTEGATDPAIYRELVGRDPG